MSPTAPKATPNGTAFAVLVFLGLAGLGAVPELLTFFKGADGIWQPGELATALVVIGAGCAGAALVGKAAARDGARALVAPTPSEWAEDFCAAVEHEPAKMATAFLTLVTANGPAFRAVFDADVYADRIAKTDGLAMQVSSLTQAFEPFRQVPEELRHVARELRDNTTAVGRLSEGFGDLKTLSEANARTLISHGEQVAVLAALYKAGALPDRRHEEAPDGPAARAPATRATDRPRKRATD